MDVDSLRKELEEQLKRNPDEHAPSGFRDRFASTLEGIEAAEDEESKTELEAELQRIGAEAEAAANCAESAEAPAAEPQEAGIDDHAAGAAEAPVPEARVEEPAATAAPTAPATPAATTEAANDAVAAPEAGLLQRYGLILAAVLVALVVAIYFYR